MLGNLDEIIYNSRLDFCGFPDLWVDALDFLWYAR